MGQLPKVRVTPDAVFNNVVLDYAGPVYLKQGSIHTCKPVIVKAYVCVFVSLSTKAAHIEAVSDLTSEAFCPLEEIRLQKREVNSIVERPRYKLRWCTTYHQGAV